jgi:hypothetical protein
MCQLRLSDATKGSPPLRNISPPSFFVRLPTLRVLDLSSKLNSYTILGLDPGEKYFIKLYTKVRESTFLKREMLISKLYSFIVL